MVHQKSTRSLKDDKFQCSRFASDHFNDDDDFTHPTKPVSKKHKVKKKTESKSSKCSSEVNLPKRRKRERVPVQDKVYERDLQHALEISVVEADMNVSSSVDNSSDDHFDENVMPPQLDKVTSLESVESFEQKDAPHLLSQQTEDFQTVSDSFEKEITAANKHMTRGLKRPKYTESDYSESDDDDGFALPSGDDSTDVSDESSFKHKTVTKKSKKNDHQLISGPKHSPAKRKRNSKPSMPEKQMLDIGHNVSTARCVSPKEIQPKRVPICLMSSCSHPQGKSPGSCVIRVGLSRKARVKPLHPSVTISH